MHLSVPGRLCTAPTLLTPLSLGLVWVTRTGLHSSLVPVSLHHTTPPGDSGSPRPHWWRAYFYFLIGCWFSGSGLFFFPCSIPILKCYRGTSKADCRMYLQADAEPPFPSAAQQVYFFLEPGLFSVLVWVPIFKSAILRLMTKPQADAEITFLNHACARQPQSTEDELCSSFPPESRCRAWPRGMLEQVVPLLAWQLPRFRKGRPRNRA